ncbi:MAG: PleD family two-component system response regulator [Rubrivivax sp.]|nr:PleD family two-component system response regulator [Rubrivivax sp.]
MLSRPDRGVRRLNEPNAVSAPVSGPSPIPALPLTVPAGRPRLLVVDDQPVNIQALYRVFAEDHQVLMATGGEQSLTQCAQQQPDLVLLDVVMPGMNGYEVCRRLKADPATREIPVIFVTAQDDELAEAAGLDVGAVDFIAKPINPRIVRARVRTHLTLKQQSDLLRKWVYVDGLTGVFNRRHFDEHLSNEWSRAVRSRSHLALVMLDVDHFKRYNDHYGHQAGDDCLRRVAAALRVGVKRSADLVARYGGEEFVCLLPDTDLAGAVQVAETLRELVLAERIAHAESGVAPVVTVSLGACSVVPTVHGSAASLLGAADAQLYAAKSGGRNRVCWAPIVPD